MNVPALRSHNAALVLDLLRTAGETGISRLELAERTGLTPQAVSKITARLRAEGLAAEAGHRASTGGKPRTVLRLAPEAGYAVGVHLDRDELTTVLTDLAGAVVASRRRPLHLGAGASRVLDAVAEEVGALLADLSPGVRAPHPHPTPPSRALPPHVPPGSTQPPAPDREAQTDHHEPLARDRESLASGREAQTDDHEPLARDRESLASGRESLSSGREFPAPDRAAPAPHPAAPADVPAEAPAPAPAPLLGVGVAMPGPLDHRAGRPGRVTGFPEWDGYPVREELARRLGLPVVLDKDTNAAALALTLRPDAPGSFAYVHLGTGLGAGIVLGGAPLRGERTGAGELGHQTVLLDGPPCDCGGRGCLEVLCLAAVARGELSEAARILGAGAVTLVRLLDVDQVLLGGRTVLGAPDVFEDGVRNVLAGLGLPTAVAVASAPQAVAVGAAWLVLAPIFGQ
ncbi:ROK family protein [Streptomyces sp. NPDC056140]|uniref:ROK family transcriptional regulator n=1 Tax=Streptomyces sp. NPDC056140 TaxID=3345725 RepID=UPI0035E32A5C